jgi:hypothetical protein
MERFFGLPRFYGAMKKVFVSKKSSFVELLIIVYDAPSVVRIISDRFSFSPLYLKLIVKSFSNSSIDHLREMPLIENDSKLKK